MEREEIHSCNTQEIKCPNCGREYSDSWEYNNDEGCDIECASCGDEFHLEVIVDVTYTTRKTEG